MWLWDLRARLGYFCARRLFRWSWLVKQPRAWQWMQGQFARMAALGDRSAQSFYGHLLLFRGQGFGSREEGIRLLRLAATAGDAKAAYQLGVLSLAGDGRQAPDGLEAARWWAMAAGAGHPLASRRLAELYRQGGHGLQADPQQAAHYAARAEELGL
ncbi:sel1 repeat family protein [Pseudomonas cavernae]|uniref:Sel1 repeat family protein n=1 Tax=Pseudomonas cavernae TaxID=2320867 RepID=A0A385Z113_9PSED|nr:sel1 repeat family protein [Pseudomonas cavernae]AYC32220.1 sel1 repeat family protein [Pseudomonas cavernae]